MSNQAFTLLAQLRAERAHADGVWAILNELRLHGLLPDWAKKLDAGTMHQAEALSRTRQEVNATLLKLIPGLEQVAQSTSRNSQIDKSDL